MEIQTLRAITTGKMHTSLSETCAAIEYLVGERGMMTHHIGMAIRALEPWLREKVADPRFWDGRCDPEHVGDYPIEPMTADEQAAFWKRFESQPNPLLERLKSDPDSVILVTK